jgi:hypothetical protein
MWSDSHPLKHHKPHFVNNLARFKSSIGKISCALSNSSTRRGRQRIGETGFAVATYLTIALQPETLSMFGHRQVGAAAEKADLDNRGHVATPFAGVVNGRRGRWLT